MAKVTFLNAILSGKLGGSVYSRNKCGYYIKQWSNPLNPNTIAQQAARSYFGNAASNWHSMTDPQKQAWNTYGQNFFKAKDEDNPCPVTGINAYLGLYFSALFYESVKRTATFSTPAGVTASFGSFAASLSAPPNRPAGVIQDSLGNPLPISLTAASLTASSGAVSVEFTMPAPQITAPLFKDPVTSENVGFIVQISLPTRQISHYISSPHRQTVAVIGPPTISSGWTSTNKFTLQCSSPDLNITKFKNWPTANQVVEVSAYLCTTGGQTSQLGAQKIVVS